MPFLFLFEPQILGLKGHVGDQLIAMAQALLAIFALNFAIEGRVFDRLSIVERGLMAMAALGLLYWLTWVELVSLMLIVGLAAVSYIRSRRAASTTPRVGS